MDWSMYVHAFQSVVMSIGVDRQVPNSDEFFFDIFCAGRMSVTCCNHLHNNAITHSRSCLTIPACVIQFMSQPPASARSTSAWATMKGVKPNTVRRSSRLSLKEKRIGPPLEAEFEPSAHKKAKVEPRVIDSELPLLPEDKVKLCTTLNQPKLSFSIHEARQHLCSVDSRFASLFAQLDLKVYDELRSGKVKELNLFRVLTTSILGQQISWLAARSIMYKFCRLFAPDLPLQPNLDAVNKDELPFPTPLQVIKATDDQLRRAGLSTAKIKYVRDVARRFSDGRLDVRKIIHMNPEACIAELTQVKGVGRWTAEMLLMFALRSPDILPVGDLGVQRGIIKFYLSNSAGPKISERKRKDDYVHHDENKAPGFLPSNSLSLEQLVSRSQGNKTKKHMYLDPDEMSVLAASWAPYRSVACMFMWSIEG